VTLQSKVVESTADALDGIADGMTVHVGGWGGIGVPDHLITALAAMGLTGLTVTTNNCGMGRAGDVGELFAAGSVREVLATFPVHRGAAAFRERLEAKELHLEIVPQGTLAERLRAAGAGLGPFFTPTGVGTPLADGKEARSFDGKSYVLEKPIRGQFALIRAAVADSFGNLRFRYATRGFSPLMAMAADITVVQADALVEVGSLQPDDVHCSGVFVDRILVSKE
jgi:3-oxoadipate CoA-transferase alpha subunit